MKPISINARLEQVANRCQNVSWDLLRIVSGLMLVVGHGYGKMFGAKPQPFIGGRDFFGIDLGINMLWIAGFIEFYVGILVILGLFTRWFGLVTAFNFIVAVWMVHWPEDFPGWWPALVLVFLGLLGGLGQQTLSVGFGRVRPNSGRASRPMMAASTVSSPARIEAM